MLQSAQSASTTGSDSIKIAVLIFNRDNWRTVALGQVRFQLTAAQQVAPQSIVIAATARAATASPTKFENKEKDLRIRRRISLGEESFRDHTPRLNVFGWHPKPRAYWSS